MSRGQRTLRCVRCSRKHDYHRRTVGRGWGRSQGKGSRTSMDWAIPRAAYEGIVLTGGDNGQRSMAGTSNRAKVEVLHVKCGHTWWTMDHAMIARKRKL